MVPFAPSQKNMCVVHSNLHWLFFFVLCLCSFFCCSIHFLSFFLFQFFFLFSFFHRHTFLVINTYKNWKKKKRRHKKAHCVESISSEFRWRHDKSINFGSFSSFFVVVRFYSCQIHTFADGCYPFFMQKSTRTLNCICMVKGAIIPISIEWRVEKKMWTWLWFALFFFSSSISHSNI